MDTTQAPKSSTIRRPQEGGVVRYLAASTPPRAALVMHVHADGRTCDLVVLGDGDPRSPLTRDAWAMGHGITRARLDIPHVSMVSGPGTLSWCHPEEAPTS
jgi:hypothetical protein